MMWVVDMLPGTVGYYIIFYVLLPYIIYVMPSGRFSHCPAFLSRTAKQRDKKYIVKSPQRYKKKKPLYFLSRSFEIRETNGQQSYLR
jgi:hypothetical protein